MAKNLDKITWGGNYGYVRRSERMYCKKCGKEVSEQYQFCIYCGTPQNTEDQNVVSSTNNKLDDVNQVAPALNSDHSSSSISSSNQINNEEELLLREYIGPAYEVINQSSFSILTFLEGFLYFWYRKMYLYGFVWFILAVILTLSPISILGFVINIIMAIQFKKIYFDFARKKVKLLISRTPNLSFEQRKQLCRKRGRTTIAPVIAVPVIIFVIPLILTPIIMNTIREERKIPVGDYSIFLGTKYEIEDQTDTELFFRNETEGKKLIYHLKYMDDSLEETKIILENSGENIELIDTRTVGERKCLTYRYQQGTKEVIVVVIALDENHSFFGMVGDAANNDTVKSSDYEIFYNLDISKKRK